MIPCSKTKDATAQLAAGNFALLICDYKLDQRTGVEFVSEMRETYATLPSILLLTPVEEISVDLAECSADLVVSKKANEVAQLVRSVERLLSRKAPRKKPTSIRKAAASPNQSRSQG